MTTAPLFPGFDGLMTLSRREGVDIRPTLLRVLTDLYVQASVHSADEERQFVELTSRLIDQVDDATRAAVRARLAIYPATPAETLDKLGLRRSPPDRPLPVAPAIAIAPTEIPLEKPPTELTLDKWHTQCDGDFRIEILQPIDEMKAAALGRMHRHDGQQRRVGFRYQNIAGFCPGKNGAARRAVKRQIIEAAADQSGPAKPGRGDPVYCHPTDRFCLRQMGLRVIIELTACYHAQTDPAACQMER